MVVEKNIVTAYLLGTGEEIRTYRRRQAYRREHEESSEHKKGYGLLAGEGLAATVLLSGGYATVASIDVLCRLGNWALRGVTRRGATYHPWEQPGLVGTIREYVQKRKK